MQKRRKIHDSRNRDDWKRQHQRKSSVSTCRT